MKRSDSIALTRRLIENIKTKSTDRAATSVTESATVFTDPDRWQRERQQFFLDTPQLVGFSGEVSEPGSILCVEAMNIPIVISRDESGVLHAFINACAHRGARVARNDGPTRRMNCAYHGWSYRLDGTLGGRPNDGDFDADDERQNLKSLAISDRCGLLVVGLHQGIKQEQVDRHLDDIAEQLQGFNFDQLHSLEQREFKVEADWKLVAGLSHEAYHFATLHRDSLAPLMTAHAVCDTFGQHSRWAFPLKGSETLDEVDEKEWPERPPAAMNHSIFPGTIIVVTATDAQIIRTEPGNSPGQSRVFYRGAYADKAAREEALAAYRFGGEIFETEDLPAAIQCQQGLNAGQDSVCFGRNEPIVQFWHHLWNERLKEEK